MSRFEIGDKVRVIDWGLSYSLYTGWIQKVAPWALEKYEASQDNNLADGMKGVVITRNKHLLGDKMLYLVDIEGFGFTIIEEDAIELESTPIKDGKYGIKLSSGDMVIAKLNPTVLQEITNMIYEMEVITIEDERGEVWIINSEHIVFIRKMK